MVGRSSIQPNSLPTMENLPVQRGAETVHISGRHRRLLPCCAQRRLGRTPQKYYPSQTSAPQQPAAIRARPVIAMPAFYARTATVYEREAWKLEKENFEKLKMSCFVIFKTKKHLYTFCDNI